MCFFFLVWCDWITFGERAGSGLWLRGAIWLRWFLIIRIVHGSMGDVVEGSCWRSCPRKFKSQDTCWFVARGSALMTLPSFPVAFLVSVRGHYDRWVARRVADAVQGCRWGETRFTGVHG